MRINRKNDELRSIDVKKDFIIHPQGSVLISFGDTKVICTAFVEEKVPPHIKGTMSGWVSAEYNMLPGSTVQRKIRDSSKGKVDGRSSEIQRLIGRSLRTCVDMTLLGERTIWIDCDVIQADGGTRTASITGGFIALSLAVKKLIAQGILEKNPIKYYLAAVSVGKVDSEFLLDLDYSEDSNAIVDMNIVMNEHGEYIEIQGTGEEAPFNHNELLEFLSLSKKGIDELVRIQKDILGDI
jgi:ribonuclease PH